MNKAIWDWFDTIETNRKAGGGGGGGGGGGPEPKGPWIPDVAGVVTRRLTSCLAGQGTKTSACSRPCLSPMPKMPPSGCCQKHLEMDQKILLKLRKRRSRNFREVVW